MKWEDLKISFFYPDLKMLYLCFHLCFYLSQANNSYSSYIFSDLTFFFAFMVFFFFYRSNMGRCDIWFFLPKFRFYFQLSEANNSYSSYIYFDLTIFCVDGIFLLLTRFQWRVQTHVRVFFAVQLNWYVIFWFGVMFCSQIYFVFVLFLV